MGLLFAVLVILGAGGGLYAAWRAVKQVRAMKSQLGEAREKAEALFRASFPELQPHFHPRQVLAFAQAWVKNQGLDAAEWRDPPGFPGSTLRRVAGEGDELELLAAEGPAYAKLSVQPHPEGLAVRLGSGKFTADLRDVVDPKVRYWHPDRQFKWSEARGWQFVTPIAEQAIVSHDESIRYASDVVDTWSSSTSTSSESTAPSFTGGGGEFGGGGASASWDEADSSSSEASSGSSDSDTTPAAASSDSGSTAY